MTRQKRACVNSSFFGWRFHSKLYDTASSKGPLPFTMINAWRISRLNPGSDASRQKSTKTSDVVLAAKKKARTINCCRCHYSNYVMTNQKTCWIMQKSCLSHKTHPFLCWIMLEEWNKGCNSDSCLHIIPRRLHETRVHGHRNKCAAWANLITVRAHYVNIRKGQVAKSLYSNLATHVTCNTQHFPKSSSESFIDKVFLKTLGQTSVALQQYGPKGFAILYLSLSFSRFCRTLWDNETEKRGTMSKAGHGGFLFKLPPIPRSQALGQDVLSIQEHLRGMHCCCKSLPVSTSYTMNCAKGMHQFKIWKNIGPFPLHDHSTGFSLHQGSCQEAHFSLSPCQTSSLPKFHLLSQFPWLGWIEAIPSESLFRRCAPKRQPSVSTWLLVDEPPLFMENETTYPKTNLSFNWLFENLFEPRTCRLIYLTAVTHTSWPQLWHFGQVWPSWTWWWQMNCSCPQPLSWSKINHKIP